MQGVMQLWSLQRHAEVKPSTVPHHHAPPKRWNNTEGSVELHIDSSWGRYILYKHKLTSLTTALHCSVMHKKYDWC